MIDLHVHILPGVDDGPEDMAESVEMCRIAADAGADRLVVTPHQRHPRWNNADRLDLLGRLAAVQSEVGRVPRLLLGAEIRVDSELLGEVGRLPDCPVLPMAGSRYLLLEFPELPVGPDARSLVHELAIAGWRPILAHPERIAHWASDPASLVELVRAGALLQVTGMSVTGEFGRRAQACCRFLLDEDLVHFVASDGHDAVERPPSLARAYRAVALGWGEERARRLMVDNPAAVIDDRAIERPA